MIKSSSVVILLVLFASPLYGQHGDVSDETLKQLGFNDLQRLSVDEGMEIRGMSKRGGWTASASTSLSMLSFNLFDPNTGSNIQLNGANYGHTKSKSYGWKPWFGNKAVSGVGTSPIAGTLRLNAHQRFGVSFYPVGIEGFGGVFGK